MRWAKPTCPATSTATAPWSSPPSGSCPLAPTQHRPRRRPRCLHGPDPVPQVTITHPAGGQARTRTVESAATHLLRPSSLLRPRPGAAGGVPATVIQCRFRLPTTGTPSPPSRGTTRRSLWASRLAPRSPRGGVARSRPERGAGRLSALCAPESAANSRIVAAASSRAAKSASTEAVIEVWQFSSAATFRPDCQCAAPDTRFTYTTAGLPSYTASAGSSRPR